jgi:hypothetical protein
MVPGERYQIIVIMEASMALKIRESINENACEIIVAGGRKSEEVEQEVREAIERMR